MSGFSSAIRITNLDDFIPQSQSCIKPVKLNESTNDNKNKKIEFDEENHSYYEISLSGDKKSLEKTTISLSDCLACSGCITSAEEVLVNLQSLDTLLKMFESRTDNQAWIVTLSSQSRASLASKYNLNMKQVFGKLITALKQIGFNYVLDANWGKNFSILELQNEFIQRKLEQIQNNQEIKPLLASSCPGWICYAEKTQEANIIDLISKTKSPQSIMGTFVKGYFYDKEIKSKGIKLKDVMHISVMPCFDKKLEASRGEFKTDIDTSEVDLVLTTTELDNLLTQYNIDLQSIEESSLHFPFLNVDESTGELVGIPGGSGGYAENLFRFAAQKLYNIEIKEINKQQKRNSDFQEFSLDIDGKTVLSFAQAYGFRNIQNIIRKIQHKNPKLRCNYDFVEVMACPSGCNNGGGQLAADPEKINPRKHLENVESIYSSLNYKEVNPLEAPNSVKKVYEEWIEGNIGSTKAKILFSTSYRNKSEMESPALREDW